MIGRSFHTIVFFGKDIPHFDFVKEEFSKYPIVRIFRTDISDELDQILKQSAKTAIILNDNGFVGQVIEMKINNLREAGVRCYFVDNDAKLTPEEVNRLSIERISTMVKPPKSEIKTKLDMFLMGKMSMGQYKTFKTAAEVLDEDKPPKDCYFTHFTPFSERWLVMASTHEQEKNIETIFERSWSVYVSNLLRRIDEIREKEEDPFFCEKYVAVVYPHYKGGKKVALSLIHIKKDSTQYDNLMQKTIEFLEQI